MMKKEGEKCVVLPFLGVPPKRVKQPLIFN